LLIPDLDPFLVIVLGDLLFNARSALDHLAVALVVPPNRTWKIIHATAFPILVNDIDEIDPSTGKHLHARDRERWVGMTKGFAPAALPVLKSFQPYSFATQNSNARDWSLAILGTLQNADKHRQLLVAASAIADPTFRFTRISDGFVFKDTPPPPPPGKLIGNGTVVTELAANDLPGVKVEIEGTPQIVVGESQNGPYRTCPFAIQAIIDNVWDCVRKLEPFVVE
jgi:hypothetical protein